MSLIIVFVASLLTAASNAGSSILQRIATGRPSTSELFSRQFVTSVTRHPLFLIGLGLQVLGTLLQAVALSQGPLSIVEPLLTTDLVFLLIFLTFTTKLRVGLKEWSGVAAVIIGLSGLYIVAQPKGGTAQYALLPWIIAMSTVTLVIIVSILATRRASSPRVRAALASIATASVYGIDAGLIKLAIHQWQTGGLSLLFSSWPIYTLIVSGIMSLYLMQNMYGAGPLAISQPIVQTLQPAISVTIGILIFGETVKLGAVSLALETLCAVILLAGIVVLGSSNKISPGYADKQ